MFILKGAVGRLNDIRQESRKAIEGIDQKSFMNLLKDFQKQATAMLSSTIASNWSMLCF